MRSSLIYVVASFLYETRSERNINRGGPKLLQIIYSVSLNYIFNFSHVILLKHVTVHAVCLDQQRNNTYSCFIIPH